MGHGDMLSPQGATAPSPSCCPGMGFPGKTKRRWSPGPVWRCGRLWPALLGRLPRGACPPWSAARGGARAGRCCRGWAPAPWAPWSSLRSGPGGRSPWAEVEPRPHLPPQGPLLRCLPGPDSSFAHQEPGPGHHARDEGTARSAPLWSPCWPWGVSDEGPSGRGGCICPSLVPRALEGENWRFVSWVAEDRGSEMTGPRRRFQPSPPGPC